MRQTDKYIAMTCRQTPRDDMQTTDRETTCRQQTERQHADNRQRDNMQTTDRETKCRQTSISYSSGLILAVSLAHLISGLTRVLLSCV